MLMGDSVVLSEDEDVIQEINMNASAGFPAGIEHRKKRGYFGTSAYGPWNKDEEPHVWCDPRRREVLRDMKVYWDDECIEPVFWTNNSKGELRNRVKANKNALRVFLGASSKHHYASTKLFVDQNSRFYRSNGKHWSFVGRSKFYLGFDKLFRRLNKHPNAFEVDETEFDSSLFREALWGMPYIRFNMLRRDMRTPENWRRMLNLYRETVDSLIVTEEGDVIQKCTGLPSGSTNTIVDNTIILFRLLAYAWLVLAEEFAPEMMTYEAFISNVEAALNGDDNTWTCSNKVVGWFNAKSVSVVWSRIGVTSKADESPASMKLLDCGFLSHRFTQLKSGVIVPVPEYEKVMCSLAYRNKCPRSAKWSLLRACALRIESFMDLKARDDIHEYIRWLIDNHYDALKMPRDMADPLDIFTYEDVMSVYKTDVEIHSLYTLEEGDGVQVDDFFHGCSENVLAELFKLL